MNCIGTQCTIVASAAKGTNTTLVSAAQNDHGESYSLHYYFDEDTKEDSKGQSGHLIVQLEMVKTRAKEEASLIVCGKIAFVVA